MGRVVYEIIDPDTAQARARVYECSQHMARKGQRYHVVTKRGALYCTKITTARTVADLGAYWPAREVA